MTWDSSRMTPLLAKHATRLNAKRVYFQDGGPSGFGIAVEWSPKKKRPVWVSRQRPESMTDAQLDALVSAAIDKLEAGQ
jgi:hypothetical protein